MTTLNIASKIYTKYINKIEFKNDLNKGGVMMASFEQRGPNKWRVVISKTTNGIRKKHQFTVTGTKKDAENAAVELEYNLTRGLVDINNLDLTVTEFAQLWLDQHIKKNLQPKTIQNYMEHLNLRILPYIGQMKINSVKPLDIVTLLDNVANSKTKHGKTISQSTLSGTFKPLSSMFNYALKWQVIPSNPCQHVKAPKKPVVKGNFYNEEDLLLVLVALDSLPQREYKYKIATYIALFTGLRLGEIMGLEWSDVDWQNKELHVERASQYNSSTGMITKEPKTEDSKRIISISESLVEMLKNYKKYMELYILEHNEDWQGTNRIFTTNDGRPMHTYTVSKWFPKFIEKHNLKKITFHGLRRTSATLLVSMNVDFKAVGARLGHSDTSMLHKIYAHALRSTDQKASEKLEDKLSAIRNQAFIK